MNPDFLTMVGPQRHRERTIGSCDAVHADVGLDGHGPFDAA